MFEPKNFIIYVDESGNSGPNYLDDQPFYVLAGWAIPEDQLSDVAALVEGVRKKFSPQRPELKTSSMLANEQKTQAIFELFCQLGALHCVPLFLVAEKKFCIAGKFIETFLDPHFNEKLRSAFTGDVATKQELANTFYEHLPEEVLAGFAQAYRQPTDQGFTKSLADIVQAAKTFVNPEIAGLLQGAESKLAENAESESGQDELWGKVATTLNMPCLVSFLMLIENLGRLGAIVPIKVVHDEQHAYGEGYKKIFDLHKGLHEYFVRLPHSDVPYSGIKTIPAFEIAASHAEPGIQCADLLAGAINHLCSKAMNGEKLSKAEVSLASITLSAMLAGRPSTSWPIISDRITGRIGTFCFREIINAQKDADRPPAEPDAEIESLYEEYVPPAAIFPVLGSEQTPTRPKFKVILPIFGYLREGALITIENGDPKPPSPKKLLPMFNNKEAAKPFQQYVSHPAGSYHLEEFGPQNMISLVALLSEAVKQTTLMIVDPDTDDEKLVSLPEFVTGLKQSVGRMQRIVSGGLTDTVINRHKIGDVEVLTMLTSDGEYIAGMEGGGPVFKGKTREEAVQLLQDSGLVRRGLPPDQPLDDTLR